MTEKTEAQPEALRLAANLRRMNMLTINCMELKQAAEALEKSHAEIVRLRALAATCYAGLGGECDLPAIWLDALNDAANGEPFDLDGLLPYTSTMRSQLVTQTNRAAAAEQQVTALTRRLDMANRLNTDARNQLAQLSARQAAPDAIGHVRIDSGEVHIYPRNRDAEGSGLIDGQLVYAAAPPPPEREPLTDEQIEAAYKNLQVRRKKDQDDAFLAGIGKICMHCSEGHYQADWNDYSTFHRCDKCRHVPFDLSGLVKKSAASCWCETCRPVTLSDMVLCPDCGNKRCPKATHHDNACTNSNAPGQPGSSWEHVKPHGANND